MIIADRYLILKDGHDLLNTGCRPTRMRSMVNVRQK